MYYGEGWYKQPVPDYSGDIAQAWQVVERMRELGYDFDLTYHDKRWYANFTFSVNWVGGIWRQADTASEAICLAALAAIGGGE